MPAAPKTTETFLLESTSTTAHDHVGLHAGTEIKHREMRASPACPRIRRENVTELISTTLSS